MDRPVASILTLALWLFFLLLIARLVLDYIQMFARSWRPHGPMLVVAEIVYTITDPPLKALRRVIPPLRIGNFALDLSMLLVFIGAYVLLRVNRAIFFS
jgi:YggT family protein